MKSILRGLFPLVFLIILSSNTGCGKKTDKTSKGIEYTMHRKGEGKQIAVGDWIKFHITQMTAKDSVFMTSIGSDPFTLQFMEPERYDMNIFSVLGIGDSATFLLNADSIYVAQ